MKNNREVCYAVDAGYAEFIGLPGKIKTGCPNTPAFKSRYCSLHIPYVAHPQSHGSDTQAQTTSSSITAPKLAGIITNKRVTRKSVLYEVQFLYIHVHVSESCMYTYMSIMYMNNHVHRALKKEKERRKKMKTKE